MFAVNEKQPLQGPLRTALLASAGGLALLVLAPLGTRAGLWSFVIGFGLLAIAVLLGAAGIVLGILGGLRTRRWRAAGLPVAAGALTIAAPLGFLLGAGGAPPIHDITTDTEDPPAFAALLPLRANAVNPPDYNRAVAEQQRSAFPDIQPLVLPVPPPEAFDRALAAARSLEWRIVAADPEAGRIEAVDTTFWFGFEDDVVVRLRESTGGTRVDVRSKSRVGVGDAGTNARRVRAFLDTIRGRQ